MEEVRDQRQKAATGPMAVLVVVRTELLTGTKGCIPDTEGKMKS